MTAAVLARPAGIGLPRVRPTHWRAAVILALSIGLWLAATVKPAAGTACTPMLSAKSGSAHVCTCPHCPGGAQCCCRH